MRKSYTYELIKKNSDSGKKYLPSLDPDPEQDPDPDSDFWQDLDSDFWQDLDSNFWQDPDPDSVNMDPKH